MYGPDLSFRRLVVGVYLAGRSAAPPGRVEHRTRHCTPPATDQPQLNAGKRDGCEEEREARGTGGALGLGSSETLGVPPCLRPTNSSEPPALYMYWL